jgi:rod shape-determining protein MreC
MRKLISFLVRYFTVITFLLLQAVAFLFIFKAQPYQRSTIYSLNAEWSGKALKAYNSVEDYLNLARINKNLAAENAALRAANKNAYFSLVVVKSEVVDTLYSRQYTYTEARVINYSYQKQNNYITLNRGLAHGVKPGQAVVATNGVVGVIKDVSKHYSTVVPIIHSKSLVSVKFKNNSFFGPLSWNGKTHRQAQMRDVPREAPIAIGDTIVSSTRSKAFPPGLNVGTVESFVQNTEDLSYEITVELAVDFAALDFVYIIENQLKSELENLEAKLEE